MVVVMNIRDGRGCDGATSYISYESASIEFNTWHEIHPSKGHYYQARTALPPLYIHVKDNRCVSIQWFFNEVIIMEIPSVKFRASTVPMFNDYREIIWLINLMNLNDNRPVISYL